MLRSIEVKTETSELDRNYIIMTNLACEPKFV